MTQGLVVAITIGQRDLQLLAEGPGGPRRVSPRKWQVRALHRALLEGLLPYSFDVPDSDAEEERSVEAEFVGGRVVLPERWGLSEGPVRLVPGLLAAALRALAAEARRVRRVIFFTTDREQGPRAEGEPIGAARVLGDWLRARAGLAGDVREVVCLERGEELTLDDGAGNVWMLPAAAEKIDAAVRQARADFPTATARLHLSGGIPHLAEMVRASSRARFTTVEDQSPSEDRGGPPRSRPPFTDVEALQARRQAAELVGQGEFAAAAVLSRRFSLPGPAGHWQKAVQAAALYFAGYMTDARDAGGQLPETRTGPLLAEIAGSGLPQAFHVAMRAEAALRAGDVLAGASLSVTFHDVALYDAADAALRANRDESCIEWDRRLILLGRFAPKAEDAKRAGAVASASGYHPRVADHEIDAWLGGDEATCKLPWQEWLLCRLVATVGKNRPLADAIDHFSSGLHKRDGKGHPPADFRNRLIHSLPDQGEIEQMVRLFEGRRLWHRPGGPSGSFLHGSALAAAVLGHLGVQQPVEMYDHLVAALLDDIANSPLHAGG